MLCGSLTLQLWQSHIVAVFPCSFFRAVEHHGVQPDRVTILPFEINLVIVCCVSIQEKVRRSPKGFVRNGNEREETGVTDELKSMRLALKLAP